MPSRCQGKNVPCTLYACSTDRVCATVDDEPVRREHAGPDREEPDGAFETGCVRRLEEEGNALAIVGVRLAKEDRWCVEMGNDQDQQSNATRNASPEDGRSKRTASIHHAPSVYAQIPPARSSHR